MLQRSANLEYRMTPGRGLPERTGSTFPTEPYHHRKAHTSDASPTATLPVPVQPGQRRPLEHHFSPATYAADNSCSGLSGKRKSDPKIGTYRTPRGIQLILP